MKITMTDVATRAGVSTATVSRVINGTGYVSDALTKKVYGATEELDYTPNKIAQSLRKRKTDTIGIIIPDNSNPFFAEISREIENFGFGKGYSVILCNSDNDPSKEKAYVNVMKAKLIDGVIFIASSSDKSNLDILLKHDIPVVVVDRHIEAPEVNVILNNNELGGYLATKHLIDQGHRRIGCISGRTDVNPSFERVDGYKRGLKEAKIRIDQELIKQGDFSYQSGVIASKELLALSSPPTAIFACNDMMALGVMKTIFSKGLSIPGDISIVGFDDISLSAVFNPSLTTVSQPTRLIAKTAVETLQNKILGAEAQERIIMLNPTLIIRESTKALEG